MEDKTVYDTMDYEDLHERLLDLVADRDQAMEWWHGDSIAALLPALEAMRRLTTARGPVKVRALPSWQQELASLNLSPATVRSWRRRTGAELRVAALLREKDGEAMRWQKPTGKNDTVLMRRLADAVLSGNPEAVALALLVKDRFPLK